LTVCASKTDVEALTLSISCCKLLVFDHGE
jgi:hypothetical protein